MRKRLRSTYASMLTGVVVLVLSLVTAPAQAQFGGLRRAVERKVEQSGEDRMNAANLIAPTFDNTTVEITAERLDRYVAAMQRQKVQVAQNRQRYDAMQAEAASLREAAVKADNRRDRETYDRATYSYGECRGIAREAAEAEYEREMEEFRARIQRDPVAAQKDPKMKEMFALLQQSARAYQSGDTASIARTQQRLNALMDVKNDSASLDRLALPKCGARPAKPRSIIVKDSLEARSTKLSREASALLESSGGVPGAEVGMSNLQSRMVWERLQSWLNGVQKDAPITRTFTKAEYDLLLSRRGDMRKAFSGS